MEAIKMWYARWFKVITIEQAKKWELAHIRNIYGDGINIYNCRSIWCDNEGRYYRVKYIKK